ncbi:MAG: MFS transporter, partial [Pseudomonadales bacterium]
MSRSVNSPKAIAAAALLSGSGAAYFMVSPYLVGTAIDSLQLSERQAGLIPSTYFFGYLLVCLTAVFWMRRFHWQFVALFGYALLISGLFGAAATDNFELLLVTTFIAGMGGGTLFGLPMCIISDSDNPDRGFGLKIVAEQAIGVVLLLGLPIYVTHTWGFKGINVVLGLVLILLAMATFWVPARGVRADDAGGYNAIAGNGVYVGIGLLALMLFFGGLSGLYAFVERLATERGFDAVSIGQSLALGTIGGGVGGFAVAVIGDRYGRSRPVAISALVLLCVIAIYATQFSKLTFAAAT